MASTSTLLLDPDTWDLVLDVAGNIAVASEPYSLAQDAASAIKTFLGECYWNTLIGVPFLTDILGKRPPLGLLKAELAAAAKTVPGVASAECFITELTDRTLAGQVQVTSLATGQVTVAPFIIFDPQGA